MEESLNNIQNKAEKVLAQESSETLFDKAVDNFLDDIKLGTNAYEHASRMFLEAIATLDLESMSDNQREFVSTIQDYYNKKYGETSFSVTKH